MSVEPHIAHESLPRHRASLPPRVSDVLADVAARRGLTVGELRDCSHRTRPIAHARFEVAALLHVMPWGIDYPTTTQIARWLGWRDHTSAVFAIRRHAEITGETK